MKIDVAYWVRVDPVLIKQAKEGLNISFMCIEKLLQKKYHRYYFFPVNLLT